MTLPGGDLPSGTKLFNLIKKCRYAAHFSKGRMLPVPWKFAFSCIQTACANPDNFVRRVRNLITFCFCFVLFVAVFLFYFLLLYFFMRE